MAKYGNRKQHSHKLDGIRSVRELREIRREVDMKLWYVEQKLSDDVAEAFSVDNLISLVAPSGSVTARIINGAETGFATVRGIVNGIRLFRRRH